MGKIQSSLEFRLILGNFPCIRFCTKYVKIQPLQNGLPYQESASYIQITPFEKLSALSVSWLGL